MNNQASPDFAAIWEDYLAFRPQIEAAVLSLGDGQQIATKPLLGFVFSMYWRCVRLFKATNVLLSAELPEEALLPARALFEDSLRLMQLAKDKANMKGLLLRWLNDSYVNLEALTREAERQDPASVGKWRTQ